LFTLSADREIRVNPAFEPRHPFLQATIVARDGEAVAFPEEVAEGYLAERNSGLAWV
jgi:hypothetical protein